MHIGWGLCDRLCLVLVCRGRYGLGGGGSSLHSGIEFGRSRTGEGCSGGEEEGGGVRMGQERLGPSYFFIPLVLGPLNSLVRYVPSLRYTRGLGWRMHCGVEVTESSTTKQHHLISFTSLLSGQSPASCHGTCCTSTLIACMTHIPQCPSLSFQPVHDRTQLCRNHLQEGDGRLLVCTQTGNSRNETRGCNRTRY